MKKIFIALAFLASLASCQKNEIEDFSPAVEKNLKTINIGANTGSGSSDTKTSITEGDEIWDIKWTKGDKLGGHSFTYDDLSGWDTNLYPFEMTTDLSSGDAESAEFAGEINAAKEKQRFMYPYKDVKCAGAMPYLSLTKQTVDLSDSKANLSKYMYMVSDKIYNIENDDYSNITMKHICAVLDLNLNFTNVPAGAKLKEIDIEGLGDTKLNFYVQFDFKKDFATEMTITNKTASYTDARNVGTNNATISIENSPELSADKEYNVPIAMFPTRFYSANREDDLLSLTVKFTVGDSDDIQEREVKKNWNKHSGYYADVLRGQVQPMSITCDLAEKALPDFTDPDGTFFLFEGNMTDSWGRIVYIDKDGEPWVDIFKEQNKGKSVGNVLQDMYIFGDKIYFLTQNGNLKGHGGTPSDEAFGRLVICDAKTLKVIDSDPLEFTDPDTNLGTWPQHLVVTDKNTAYIQFSTHMETHSGVYKINISDDSKEVTNKGIIDGTYGEFTKTGATKARMTLSRNKIFMGRGASFISIDTQSDAVTVIETFENKQVKDVTKAGDGNIYVAVSGEGSSEGSKENGFTNTMTSSASIEYYNQSGVKQGSIPMEGYSGFDSNIGFPIDSPSPNIGMCATFNDNTIYFRDKPQFSCSTFGRIDDSFGNFWLETNANMSSTTDPVYGYMGVHPKSGNLFVGYSTNAYTTGTIEEWSYSSFTWSKINTYSYTDRHHASPAGIDFGYRFTTEWINK